MHFRQSDNSVTIKTEAENYSSWATFPEFFDLKTVKPCDLTDLLYLLLLGFVIFNFAF